MNTNTFKVAAVGMAAAAVIGCAALDVPKPAQAATVEACVIRATETGACIIPGTPREILTEEDPEPVIIRTAELYTHLDPVEGILPSVCSVKAYTEEELELLACVIYCEAGGDACTDATRRMVGEVVLNRVADPRFPDTILGVLTQKSQYGRFHWTGVVWPSRAAYEPEAVERAYNYARMVFEEERLLPTACVFQAEFVQGTICAQAKGFYFCR